MISQDNHSHFSHTLRKISDMLQLYLCFRSAIGPVEHILLNVSPFSLARVLLLTWDGELGAR